MLVTREMDYAVRVLRALSDGQQHASAQVAQAEHLPAPMTYKLLKRLSAAGLVESRRGAAGGYVLVRPCVDLTLLDVFRALDSEPLLNECQTPGYQCPNDVGRGCGVRCELSRIQECLNAELRRRSLAELFAAGAGKGEG